MVAFAKEYVSAEAHRAKVGLPTESPARSQNRAECFFAQASARAGHGAPATRLHAGENGRRHYDACQGASLAQGGETRQETKEEVLFFTTDEYYPVNDRVLARFGGAAKLLEKFGNFLSDLDYIDSRTGNQIKQFLGIDDTITPVLRYGRENFFLNSDYVFGGTEYLGSSVMTIYGPQDIASSPTLQSFMEIMGASDPLQYNRIVKVRHYTEAIWRKPGE